MKPAPKLIPQNERKVMTVYVTKFALTTGIIKCEAEDCGRGMVQQIGAKYPTYFHGRDWHKDLPSAEARAEEMRVNKIKSLEKQIKKMHAHKVAVVKR